MGNGSCTCSDQNEQRYKYKNNMDHESMLCREATELAMQYKRKSASIQKKEKPKKIQKPKKMQNPKKRKRIQKQPNMNKKVSNSSHIAHFSAHFSSHLSHFSSHSSFDDEFYIKQSKSLQCQLGSFKFLIYIEHDFIDYYNKLIYGFIMRSHNFKQNVNNLNDIIQKMVFQYLFTDNDIRNLLCVGVIVLNQEMDIYQVKQDICTKFNHFIDETNMNYIRLRHIWSIKQQLMTKAYSDRINLKKNCKLLNGSIADHMRICVQKIDKIERIKKRHLVLRYTHVYRRNVNNDESDEYLEWQFDEFQDKIFNIKKIDDKEYIEIPYSFQHHSFNDFVMNEKYINYYCNNHQWHDISLPFISIDNISSGDFLLFIHDESMIINRNCDIWE